MSAGLDTPWHSAELRTCPASNVRGEAAHGASRKGGIIVISMLARPVTPMWEVPGRTASWGPVRGQVPRHSPPSSPNIATACSGVTMSLSSMISRMGTSIAEMACGVISGSSIAWSLVSRVGQ